MLASEPIASPAPKESPSEPCRLVTAQATPAEALFAAIEANDGKGAMRHAVNLYANGIGRLCMAFVRDRALAEDLVQETFVTALQGFARYAKTGTFRAYLYGIARNLSIAALEKKRIARVAPVDTGGGTARSSEEIVLAREERSLLDHALGKLRPSDREVLLLRYVTDLEYAELAHVLASDEATVRKRVSRALVSVRSIYFEEAK